MLSTLQCLSPLAVALGFGGNPGSNHSCSDELLLLLALLIDHVADEVPSLLHEVAVRRVREDFHVVLVIALLLVREERPTREVQTRQDRRVALLRCLR